MRDFVDMDVLHTESTSLYWGFTKNGEVGLYYFTMADIYSHSNIYFDYQDVKNICEFLDDWGHESLFIEQIYRTTRNGKRLRCSVKFEYVETDDPNVRRSQQRITFYDDYTEEDPEQDEDILSWSSWDDYYNHEKFESFRDFMHAVKSFWERAKE